MENLYTLIATYKYALLLPIAIVEGPIVIIIASFLASLGLMSVVVVYCIGVLGNLTGDVLYYSMGRFGGRKFLVRYGKRVGVDETKVARLDAHYENHLIKTLVVGKMTEGVGILTILSAGMAKVDFKKFITISVLAEIPKVFIIVCLGYFLGKFYVTIDIYFKDFAEASFVLVMGVILGYSLYRKFKQ